MSNDKTIESSDLDEYICQLIEELPNQIHKRIILAYRSDNPVQLMESELGSILSEVLSNED